MGSEWLLENISTIVLGGFLVAGWQITKEQYKIGPVSLKNLSHQFVHNVKEYCT